jgi:hypothetical protein
MKNIKTLILMSLIGMLCFAELAFGQTSARDQSYKNSEQIAISPYAQAVPNDSYTFIGISHPSLRTAAKNIGVVVETVGMNTTSNTPSGRSAVFTIAGGETHRVFVVNQSHASINGANAAFTDDRTHLITTTDTSQFGSIRVTTVDETPTTLVADDLAHGITNCTTLAHMKGTAGCGYETLNQLSMWGIVYSEAAGTGFAMEFIGDMQDSKLVFGQNTVNPVPGGTNLQCAASLNRTAGCTATKAPITRPGAGVN